MTERSPSVSTAKEKAAMAHIQTIPASSHSLGLAEVLERVLDKGLVIAGDIKIKLCDVELLTIQIRLLVASVDKAREMGLTWWWQSAPQQPMPHERPASLTAPETAHHTPWEQYQQFQRRANSTQEP